MTGLAISSDVRSAFPCCPRPTHSDRSLRLKATASLRLLHKDVGLAVGLGRDVGVPMRLASLVYEELTEAMNRGWSARNSSVSQLLQVERAGIPPLAADPERIAAVLDADKQK